MNLKLQLLLLSFLLIVGFLTTITLYIVLDNKLRRKRNKEWYSGDDGHKDTLQTVLNQFYQKVYIKTVQFKLTRRYVRKLKKRLEAVHKYDEYRMRKVTMRVFLTISIVVVLLIVLIFSMNQNWFFSIISIFMVVVIHDVIVNQYIGKIEMKILTQMTDFLADVRHSYHEHGMVDEAIYEAYENTDKEISIQGERIYELLISTESSEALRNYFDTAPNKYLKIFAGLCHQVKEMGDRKVDEISLFLRNITYLNNEVNMEILKRGQLSYQLKNINLIAAVPLLMIQPIEKWTLANFPASEMFYGGAPGLFVKLIIVAIVFLAYLFLKNLQIDDTREYKKDKFQEIVEKNEKFKRVGRWLVPLKHTKKFNKLESLFKESGERLSFETYYLKRIVIFIVAFSVGFGVLTTVKTIRVNRVYTEPTTEFMFFDELTEEEYKAGMLETNFDNQFLYKMKGKKIAQNEVVEFVKKYSDSNSIKLAKKRALRIYEKHKTIESMYFKWYELLFLLFFSGFCYSVPHLILVFTKHMRQVEMEKEILQFHTLVLMLIYYERVSVEGILEWLELGSNVFKEQLQTCLNDYESGPLKAIKDLKKSVSYAPMIRIVENLESAVERIPIKRAFDEIQSERAFYQEKRRVENERIIKERSSWGKLIGFVPLYALIFLYLVFPLLGVSYVQMQEYYNQMNIFL